MTLFAKVPSAINSKPSLSLLATGFTRKLLSSNASLARKVKSLEKKYNEQFRVVFEAIYNLMDASEKKASRKIGFKREKE